MGVERDKGLTPCGIEQAKQVAKALQRMPGRPSIVKMVRAMETAEIVSFTFPEVRQVSDSDLQGGRLDSIPNQARFERAYETYFRPIQGLENQTEVIVCHANVILTNTQLQSLSQTVV